MKYYIDDIVKDVRIALDEIGINDADFLGTDQDTEGADEADLDTIIKSKIIEALRFCILSADSKLVGPGTTIKLDADSAQSYGIDLSLEYNEQSETKVVKAVMPENFLRLLYAYIKGWPYAVSKVIDVTDPQYAELMNPVTTGTEQRPAVGMRKYYEAPSTEKMDRFVVELFSTKDNATLNNLQGGISILTEPVTHEEAIPEPVTAPDIRIVLNDNIKVYGTLVVTNSQAETFTKTLDVDDFMSAFVWNKTKGSVEFGIGDLTVVAKDTGVSPVTTYGTFNLGQLLVAAADLSVGYNGGPIVSNAPTSIGTTEISHGGGTYIFVPGKSSCNLSFYPVSTTNPEPAILGNVHLRYESITGFSFDFNIDLQYPTTTSREEGAEEIAAGHFGYARAAVPLFYNRSAAYIPPTINGWEQSGLSWDAYCQQVRQSADLHITNFVYISAGATFSFTGSRVPGKWTDSYYLPDLYDSEHETSHPMFFLVKKKTDYATMVTALDNDPNSEDNILTANTEVVNGTDITPAENCYLALIAYGKNVENFANITYSCNGEEDPVPEEEGGDAPVPGTTDYETPVSEGNSSTTRTLSYARTSGGSLLDATSYNIPLSAEYYNNRLTLEWYPFRKTISTLRGEDSAIVEDLQQSLSFSGVTPDADGAIEINRQDVINSLLADHFLVDGQEFALSRATCSAFYDTNTNKVTLDLILQDNNGNELRQTWTNAAS